MCVAAFPMVSYILSPFFLEEPDFLYRAKKSTSIVRKGSSFLSVSLLRIVESQYLVMTGFAAFFLS